MMEAMEEVGSNSGYQSGIDTTNAKMRFNELITGIRQDVAIKIYGEDLEVLTSHAGKLAGLIKKCEGKLNHL